MSTRVRTGVLTTGAVALTVIFAVPAGAAPECDDFAPNTRICRSPGHTAIVTSPNPAFTNPYPGWGFGTLGIPAIGIAGRGIWIGI